MSNKLNEATNDCKNETTEDESNTTWIWLVAAFIIMIAIDIYTS